MGENHTLERILLNKEALWMMELYTASVVHGFNFIEADDYYYLTRLEFEKILRNSKGYDDFEEMKKHNYPQYCSVLLESFESACCATRDYYYERS